MPRIRLLLGLIAVALSHSPVLADQADDERAIREVQVSWDDAWNRYDVQALAALVAEDVRFVNVAGLVLTGRTEFGQLRGGGERERIARRHAELLSESFRAR